MDIIRRNRLLPKLTLVLTMLCLTGAVHAAGSLPLETPSVAEILRTVHKPDNYFAATVSPDGRWVTWTKSSPPSGEVRPYAEAIYVASVTGVDPARRLTAMSSNPAGSSAVDEKSPAWSPDSRSIAFLSDAESPGQFQLYVARLGQESVRRVTQLKGFLAAPRWSPDGKTIAFLYTEDTTRAAGPLEAVPQEVGVIGDQVLEQRIATVDTETGILRRISPEDLYVYEYDWSPDGSTIVATAAHGSGDNHWYVAEIFLIDAGNGTARSFLKPDRQVAVPRWSPDGRMIAFIGGLMSDESIASGEVYVMPVAGGTARNVSSNNRGSTYWLTWLGTSGKLLLADAVDGGSGLTEVDPTRGTLHALWQGAETIRGGAEFARGIAVSKDGKMTAVIRESFGEAPRVWVGKMGAWTVRTPANPEDGPKLWGTAQSILWSSDGFRVQGWLVPPAHVEAGKRYPMVVWAHGGPAWLNSPGWSPNVEYATVLAARGYYVFLPNPRGSAGFGETFKRANIKDMGGGDLRDILAGVREVLATYPVDNRRVGITGWSYGGYMTMWAITQTDQFRAAVAGAGCADLLSYYGENGIDEWLIPYFGASVYDDPAVYAKSSPINFIKRVHAPTLLIVGDSDVESPPAQSYEYWHALKTLGVKTGLVVYPHEGHEFADPAHVLDRLQRTTSWFDANMPAQ